MNTKEVEQINFIHEQYRNCGLGEIPACLEFNIKEKCFGLIKEVQGLHSAKKTNLEASLVNATSGDNPLYAYAEDIVTKICDYQKTRNERLFGGGNLADPTNLLLEELKRWVIEKLSVDSCLNLEPIVRKRIRYLEAIERSDLFPVGKDKYHLVNVIVDIVNILKNQIQPKIQDVLENESAGEELRHLVTAAEKLVKHTIEYLYFVMRDGKASTDYTFDNLRAPRLSDTNMGEAMETASGKLLGHLVKASPIQELFPSRIKDNKNPSNQISGSSDGLVLALQASNNFMESQGSGEIPCANTKLLTYLLEAQQQSGIYSVFLKDKAVISAFVEVHGLILEFARFALICQRFRELAGFGGDILIYGIANRPVKFFIRTYFPLVNALFLNLMTINQLTQKIYSQEIASGIVWIKYSRSASDFYTVMMNEKSRCDEYAAKILSKAERGIDEKRQAEIKQKIGIGIDSAIQFASSMYGFFPNDLIPVGEKGGLKYSPALLITNYEPETNHSGKHQIPLRSTSSNYYSSIETFKSPLLPKTGVNSVANAFVESDSSSSLSDEKNAKKTQFSSKSTSGELHQNIAITDNTTKGSLLTQNNSSINSGEKKIIGDDFISKPPNLPPRSTISPSIRSNSSYDNVSLVLL